MIMIVPPLQHMHEFTRFTYDNSTFSYTGLFSFSESDCITSVKALFTELKKKKSIQLIKSKPSPST